MKFQEFSSYLNKLDQTSKRLEMTEILSLLIKDLSKEEVKIGVYLSLGSLKAPFENLKFNFADKQMIKTLAIFSSKTLEEINHLYASQGDLGSVGFLISKEIKNPEIQPNLLSIYSKLEEIALLEGTGSQDKKANKIINLLQSLDPLSIKFTIRIILGNNRLGFTELTVVDALCKFLENKSLKSKIEDAYNRFPDIGYIAEKIKELGIEGINKVKITPGVPILPQRAQRLSTPEEIIEKMGVVWCEYKFDGTRVQLHLDKSNKIQSSNLFGSQSKYLVKTFTRNLEETTHQYPDIIQDAINQLDVESVILDGEAIGFNRETNEYLPFQETIQRKRKHNVAEMAKQVPLKYLVFDLLYLNGVETINLPLIERRKLLNQIVKKGGNLEIDNHIETNDVSEVENFFNEAKHKRLEGIMVKKPDSPYEAGARAFSWIKFKRNDNTDILDTVDVVILGYFFGKGVRSEFGIGGFLVGIYNHDTNSFKTVSKIGSGLTDEEWVKIKKDCDKIMSPEKPKDYEVSKEMFPDVWVKPQIVVTVRADEVSISQNHSAGIALRFPRLISFRDDKSPFDTTTIEEIKVIYNLKK
jgi:DNA ligase-1